MNKKQREAFAAGNAKNDQAREGIFSAIKGGYQNTPDLTDAVRLAICKEANHSVSQTDGVIGSYMLMRQMILKLGMFALQDRLAEWLETGEIPEGDPK